jgi:hypothetical protein
MIVRAAIKAAVLVVLAIAAWALLVLIVMNALLVLIAIAGGMAGYEAVKLIRWAGAKWRERH